MRWQWKLSVAREIEALITGLSGYFIRSIWKDYVNRENRGPTTETLTIPTFGK